MRPLLNEFDYQKQSLGADTRWHNTAQWARFKLVKEGLLKSKSDSPHGVWELSDKGTGEVNRKKI